MANKGKIRYVFASSYTNQGFFTFIPKLLEGMRKVFILKGAAGSGKSTLIRFLGEAFCDQGYEIEFWVSALDSVSPEGVYIPRLEAAVVDGSLPQAIDPKYPGITGEIINLGEFWDKKALYAHKDEIIRLINQVEKHRESACSHLRSAGRLKNEIRQTTAVHLNIGKIQQYTEELAREILDYIPGEKHYFASAVTSEGMINYIDEISSRCQKRIILKGPAGSGKSTIISNLASQARDKGYFLEYYHCGLDPDSLVMVVILNLGLALVDAGTMEISIKPWDRVIDTGGCLDEYEPEELDVRLSEDRRAYETFMLKAQSELGEVHRSIKELKKVYTALMDFKQLDQKCLEIRQEMGEIF